MKSLLPIIVTLALIGGCCANHFKLPPFRVFDKNSDGTFTDTEAGQLLIDAARVLTQVTGKNLFRAVAKGIPEMRDGKLTKEEYKEIEDQIRARAQFFLEKLKSESGQLQGRVEVINYQACIFKSRRVLMFGCCLQSEARKYLGIVTSYAEKYLQDALDGMQDMRPAFEVLEIVRTLFKP